MPPASPTGKQIRADVYRPRLRRGRGSRCRRRTLTALVTLTEPCRHGASIPSRPIAGVGEAIRPVARVIDTEHP